MSSKAAGLEWWGLPRIAQLYVCAVIAAGAVVLITHFPVGSPHPILFAALLLVAVLTSTWKVNLPISLASGSTLSVSYAASLTTLLLLGPEPAIVVAIAGALAQCTIRVKQRYPLYRTAFSMAAFGLTMWATGEVYQAFGGSFAPQSVNGLAGPLLGAITTYFLVNTGLIAIAIAWSTRQSAWKIWHHDFLWSASSFVVAATAGAIGAVIIAHGRLWEALLMGAPIYLTYRTYHTVIGRLEDQRRHLEQTRQLHDEAVMALAQARRAEQALTAEKERLAVTLRSIADGVIATDPGGVVVLINQAAEAMTGWMHGTAIGKPITEVSHSVDAETRTACDNSFAALTTPPLTAIRRCTLLLSRDRAERPIEQSAAMLCDDNGRTVGMVLVFHDITSALKAMEERAKANKLSALGLLAGGMAHDFNNILMTIMGNVSMARATAPESGDTAMALSEAEQGCIRARHLTWQLLTFSKGGIPTRKTFKPARTVTESVELALRGSRAHHTISIQPDLWEVDADESQLTQVFTNIVVNAAEAMPEGGSIIVRAENAVESAPRLEHALRVEPGRYVRVSISDTGIGIPPEHLARLFDPYFSTKQGASGLGLATAHSIIKNHGGFLSVDAEPGRGTTVTINVPAATAGHSVEILSTESIRTRRRRKPRVLVMDDEPAIRRVASHMLQHLGYHAEVVDNGNAAIERFAQALKKGRPFDVVLLDLVVPGGMGGKEAMDQLARLVPSVKGVLVSGYIKPAVIEELRDHGFGAVITKPFTLEELHATLSSVLAPSSGAVRVH